VMSDSEDSTVTYTEVSSPFTDLSNIGSPGVDGPPVMPEDPYAYVVAAFQTPPSPDYVSGLEEPEQDEVLLDEEQPLPAALSPTADSPGYVPESYPKKDPEEDDDGDLKEDPADYPADGGDDGDDEDESSDDDEDDDVDIKDDEEEEEHLAPANSTAVALPIILSPPLLPILSPLPVSFPPPASPTYPLGYRVAIIRLRAEAPSTSHSPLPHIILSHTRADTPSSRTPSLLPIPLPTSSPSLLLPSTDHGADRPEVCLPLQKRLCFAFGPRYEVGESSSAAAARPTRGFKVDYGFVATIDRGIRRDLERDVSYGITDTWDEMLVDMPGAPTTDDTELGRRMTDFSTRVRQDTDEIYVRDRRAHARTALLMEREARMSREAKGRSMEASDLAHSEVMSLRTTILGQQAVITELQAADRRRQETITELLAADRRRQAQFIEALKLLKRLQTQMTKFESQQRPAKGLAQPDAPEEAGSSS
ncbi:hypothetical protein Tco_0741211, partial [Tanacetum coccineum]